MTLIRKGEGGGALPHRNCPVCAEHRKEIGRLRAEREKLAVEWANDLRKLLGEKDDLASRLDAAVSALQGMYEWQGSIQELLPEDLSKEVQAVLFGEGPDDGWTTLGELRAGAVFETEGGVRAVKTQYGNNARQFFCYDLAGGDAAHFPEGNNTRVRELPVGEPAPEEG